MAPPTENTPLLAGSHGRANAITPPTPPTSHDSSPTETHHAHLVEMPPTRVLAPILATLWVPVFVSSLDATVVATLVGSISSSFSAAQHASWLGSSYLLSLCCFNPLMGRLADVFGTRASLLISIALFTAGTLGCGLAPSLRWFLASRVVAGAGGGGLTTTSNIHMSKIIPLRNRGLFQGLTNIVFGVGSGLGGPVGGFANDSVGWRNAFTIQVPFLALATLLCLFYIRDVPSPDGSDAITARLTLRQKLARIDFLGAFTLVGCVSCILVPLSLLSGGDCTLRDPLVYGLLLASCGFFLVFLYVEARFAVLPVLPLQLLSSRTGISVALTNFTLSVTAFATLYTFPLFFQAVRLQSSSQAGLHLIPYSICLSISSVTAGWYMRQTGRFKRYNIAMSTMQALSALIMFLLTPSTPEWLTYVAIAPMGVGGAGILTCTLIAIINAVPRSQIAVATAMTYLFRTTGQVLGVSLSGTILQFSLKDELHARFPHDTHLVEAIRHSSTLIPHLPPAQREQAALAYFVSLRRVFAFMCLVGLVTLAGSFIVEDRQLPEFRKAGDAGEEGEQPQQQQQGVQNGEGQRGE